jgi:ligand-binding SRPBCC domain-containing protein
MRFCFEHTVPLPREVVFAFFENPERLELLHAGWSKVRLLRHEKQVRVGAQTWIEATLGGFVPMVLGFQHTLFEPPVRFGEEAFHGPFSKFAHIHEFHPRGLDTVVHDLLDIRLPPQYGGETMVRRIVSPRVVRMFQFRAQALGHLVTAGIVARCAGETVLSKKG